GGRVARGRDDARDRGRAPAGGGPGGRRGDQRPAVAKRQDDLHEGGVSRGETWAIVVAAGSGARLGADRPKAFVRFGERTLLAASLEILEEHDGIDGVVVTVPEGWEERTSVLVEDLCASKVAAAVAGGETRPDSVAAGLAELPDACDRVLVHDAARPLVDHPLIDRVLAALDAGAEAVVPALDIPDTVKRVDG